MRRFEHANGRFWSIDEHRRQLTIQWGFKGDAGQRREIHFAQHENPAVKLRELVAKQVELGYIEVMDVADLVSTMKENVRWYRKLVLGDHSVAVAVDGRCVYTWRDGEGEPIDEYQDDFAEAKQHASEILAGAIARGMVLTDEDEPRSELDAKLDVRVANNPALEAQCRAAPDDPGPWLVYADWLMTESDVRGELAALRAKGKESEADALFRARQAQLFEETDTSLADAVTITSWRHGFARAATIKTDIDNERNLHEATAKFLALPIAMFIDELRFGLAGFESNNNWAPTLAVVTDSMQAPWLRVLRFDDFSYEDSELSWAAFGNFTGFWEHLPALEELRIRSGEGGVLGVLDLPKLKKFVRVSGGLRASEISKITSAKWPALEHLEVWFGRANYGAEGDATMLAPIFAATNLPALRHLGIVNCEFSLGAIEALLGSKLLPQLRTLDLSRGIIAARELEVLLANASRFAHLTSIDVTENYLDGPQVGQLQRALPNVNAGDQRELEEDDGEEYRYARLGE